MRVRIYLKSGRVLKLRGVDDLNFSPDRRISWKCHGRWRPLHIDPSEVTAIMEHRKWWP